MEPQTYTVLLVDDDPLFIKLGLKLLLDAGYEAASVNSGAAALERVAEESFDIIVMDCHMPGMNGFDTARRLRKAGHCMPILAMTIETRYGIIEECHAAGMDLYLKKPLIKKLFLQIIRTHAGKHHVLGKEFAPL